MSRHPVLKLLVLASVMIAAPPVPSSTKPFERSASAAGELTPDYAPIVERKLDFCDFAYQTVEGGPFDLREIMRKARAW